MSHKDSVDVRLVDHDRKTAAIVKVDTIDHDGKMPKLLVYRGRVFEFDNGLEHCGERYCEINSMLVTPDMLIRHIT